MSVDITVIRPDYWNDFRAHFQIALAAQVMKWEKQSYQHSHQVLAERRFGTATVDHPNFHQPYPSISINHHISSCIIQYHSPFLTCPSIPSDKKSLIKLLLKNAQLGSSLIPRSCDVTCGAPQKNLPLQHLHTLTWLQPLNAEKPTIFFRVSTPTVIDV